jgi:alanine racemase
MNHSWVEISLERLRNNVAAIRLRIGPGVDIIAVVKANAYGHGATQVAACLSSAGISSFVTATVSEAIEVRQVAPEAAILVLSGCEPGHEKPFTEHRLRASVFDTQLVPAKVPVEVKIDTGMGRLGISPNLAPDFMARFGDRLQGVFSHFASSETDDAFSHLQLDTFLRCTKRVSCRRHLANSGALRFPAAFLDAVRPGLALYGIAPCPEIDDVIPVLTWKTRVLTVREIPRGASVGYNRTFTAGRQTRVAVLPVGYADGYSRAFSNSGQVRIRGRLAAVVGVVSMDLTTVDVTDIPGVSVGDETVLLEADAQSPLSAVRHARSLGTIPYEVFTSIGPRVERRYI